MKKQMKHFIAAVLFFTLCFFFRDVPAQAATLEKITSGASTASFRRDLTGDSVTEKVSITAKNSQYGEYGTIVVSVNGKKAATLKPKYSFYSFDVQYISMSKNKKFIVITATTDNDYEVLNAIYRYDSAKKKLVRVLDFNFKYGTSHTYESVTKVTSSSITIHYSSQFLETGYINWDFIYTYKSGKFKLKTSLAKVESGLRQTRMNDGYDKYFKNNQFKVTRTLTFYTNGTLSKKAFTAKKGDVLTLQKICVTGKKVFLRFKKNGKTGWIKIGNSYSSVYKNSYTDGWFYGTGRRLAG